VKNKTAFIGMIFGAGIGIIFNSTGLGLPIGTGVGFVLGMLIQQQQKKNVKK
jgi:F0F1-type ATP synthase assembly protein I